MTKTCFTCKEVKPRTEFGVHARSKDGLRGQCLVCRTAYVVAWRKENIEAVRATARKFARKNSDKRKSYLRAYNTGFTDEHFKAKCQEQGGACAICGTPLETLPSKAVHADHDHKTGQTRGVLCRHCNRGLGGFLDSPDLLERAAEYLRQYIKTEELLK